MNKDEDPVPQGYSLTPTTGVCPVCAGKAAITLYTANSGQAAQHFVLREADEARHLALKNQIEKLWLGPQVSVQKCAGCEFVYAFPFVAGDRAFYELAFRREHYPSWKWEFQATRESLMSLALQTSASQLRLLEIGAGDGGFLRGVSPSILDGSNIVCTEFSDYGARRLTESGFKCFSLPLPALAQADVGSRFDIICLFQVFEHLDDPHGVFSFLSGFAADKCNLYLAVPNPNWTNFGELNHSLLDMPPNHVGRWRPNDIARVAETHGWHLIEHRFEPSAFWEKWRSFLKFSYFRQTQSASSVCNRLERIRPRAVRRFFQVGMIALIALRRMGSLRKLLRSDLGLSLWLHLRRS